MARKQNDPDRRRPFTYSDAEVLPIFEALGAPAVDSAEGGPTRTSLVAVLESAARSAIDMRRVLGRRDTPEQAIRRVVNFLDAAAKLTSATDALGPASALALFGAPPGTTEASLGTPPPWGWVGEPPGSKLRGAEIDAIHFMARLQAFFDCKPLDRVRQFDLRVFRSRGRPSEVPKRYFTYCCLDSFETWTGRPATAGDARLHRFVAAAVAPTGLHQPPGRRSSASGLRGIGVSTLVRDAFDFRAREAARGRPLRAE